MWHADSRMSQKRKSDTAAAIAASEAVVGRIAEDDLAIPAATAQLRPSRSSSDIARSPLFQLQQHKFAETAVTAAGKGAFLCMTSTQGSKQDGPRPNLWTIRGLSLCFKT